MGDNPFKQTLRAIGREAVPDDWDRWGEIQRRVREDSIFNRRAAPPRRWLKRIAALLAVMLVSSGAIYAFVQMPPPPTGDTGLDGVKAAGLVTDLNLVQTVDGVQIQLNWGYIDEGRAVLNYQTFLVDDDGSRHAADADEPTILRLSERNGRLPDLYPNQHGHESYPKPVTISFYLWEQQVNGQDLPDEADLRLEIAYDYRPRIRNAIERIFYSEIRRSTFGWNNKGIREPLPPEALSFAFDFTLPIQQAVTLEPMLTVTASDLAMTLESISVSPSKTDYRLCYMLPDDDHKGWYFSDVTLKIGESAASFGGFGGKTGKDGRTCTEGYTAVYTALPGTLTLTVEALERHPFDAVDELLRVQREMNARGIEMWVEVKPDGTAGGYMWPSNTEESQAVLAELGYWIEGPWVFTVDVPAPEGE